jgi:hypothetical protein
VSPKVALMDVAVAVAVGKPGKVKLQAFQRQEARNLIAQVKVEMELQ